MRGRPNRSGDVLLADIGPPELALALEDVEERLLTRRRRRVGRAKKSVKDDLEGSGREVEDVIEDLGPDFLDLVRQL